MKMMGEHEPTDKPGRPLKDLIEYAYATLRRVNGVMDGFEREGYVEIEFSGTVAILLPYVRIKIPDGKEGET